MNDSTSAYTQQDPADSVSDFNLQQFRINQALARVRTMVMVEVMGIAGGAGAVAAPGTVNVKPLVKIVDGNNNASSHGTIMNIPVFRYGSGNGVIICDPVVGDTGWMAVADRDSSVAVKTKKEAQPGSSRKFNLADGVYMGSILSGVPTQYVTFTENGVTIKSGTDGINLNGLKINQQGQIDGNLPVTGALELGGTIESLAGGEYSGNIATTGTVSGSDMIANPGAAQVTLRGHISSSSSTPPTPGH